MRDYLNFKKARKIVRGMGFKNMREYRREKTNYKILRNIPHNPHEYYKEWVNWYDWLGTSKRTYLSFEDARKFVRHLKLKRHGLYCSIMWREYCRSGNRPSNILLNPKNYRGWKGWYDWFGIEKYMSFKKARRFVRCLKLKGFEEWKEYCKSGNRPYNIPSDPYHVYKEWVDWMDWLNTKNVCGSLRQHRVNDSFFKKWSYNNAYILGFWFADGCIMDGGIFKIAQHKNDEYLLVDMLKCMNTDYKVVSDGKMRYIVIFSDTIVQDIIKLGGKYRKSLDVEFPYVPKKYLPDFIRGLWDGDGCISVFKNGDLVSTMTSGSKIFIEEMLKILRDNIDGLNGRMVSRKTKRIWKGKTKISQIYNIILSPNDSRRLRDYMYKRDGLCLKRKRDKFMSIGEINIATYNRKFLPYKKARLFVRKLGLKKWKDWFAFSQGGSRPSFIPGSPWNIYRNKGWVNFNEFIGR